MLSIQTYCVDFINIGNSSVTIGKIANLLNWTYISIHAIHGFKYNAGDLISGGNLGQFLF